MQPLLHNLASSSEFDLPALKYSANRLPEIINLVKKVIISQNQSDFDNHDVFHDIGNMVVSKNRRRLMFYDPGVRTLCCVINSDSDIDDLINLLLIYQVESRKIKNSLITPEYLISLSGQTFDPDILLYPTSESNYLINCQRWWYGQAAKTGFLGLNKTPVYFVSSNSHSLINIIGGYINSKQNYIFDYIASHHADIYRQWFDSKVEKNLYQVNDFLYYLSGEFLKENPEYINEKKAYEKSLGLIELNNLSDFPVNTQIIPLKSLVMSKNLDANLTITLQKSL